MSRSNDVHGFKYAFTPVTVRMNPSVTLNTIIQSFFIYTEGQFFTCQNRNQSCSKMFVCVLCLEVSILWLSLCLFIFVWHLFPSLIRKFSFISDAVFYRLHFIDVVNRLLLLAHLWHLRSAETAAVAPPVSVQCHYTFSLLKTIMWHGWKLWSIWLDFVFNIYSHCSQQILFYKMFNCSDIRATSGSHLRTV